MTKNPAAVALGSIKTAKKTAAVRENGKLGGRPAYLAKARAYVAQFAQEDGEAHEQYARQGGFGGEKMETPKAWANRLAAHNIRRRNLRDQINAIKNKSIHG